jgi:hypothetical protein
VTAITDEHLRKLTRRALEGNGCDLMRILPDHLVNAWCAGEIENLRFNPVTQLLTYRPTSGLRLPVIYDMTTAVAEARKRCGL